MNSAGIVKMVPLASEVLAEPIVCARFASRMVLCGPPNRCSAVKTATAITAAGMAAETVRPTRRPR